MNNSRFSSECTKCGSTRYSMPCAYPEECGLCIGDLRVKLHEAQRVIDDLENEYAVEIDRLRAELEQADKDLEATQDTNSKLESDNEAFHGFFEGEDGSGLPAHDIISNFCTYYVVVDRGRIEKAEARVRELEKACAAWQSLADHLGEENKALANSEKEG